MGFGRDQKCFLIHYCEVTMTFEREMRDSNTRAKIFDLLRNSIYDITLDKENL